MTTSRLLGQRLLAGLHINKDQLQIGLQEQGQHPLGETLVQLGFISEELLVGQLSAQLGIPCADLEQLVESPFIALPEEVVLREQCLPLAQRIDQTHKIFTVALADPQDLIKLDRLRRHLPPGWTLHPQLAGRAALARRIETLFGRTSRLAETLSRLTEQSHGQAIIELADELLADAAYRGASDIHFEPEAQALNIRLRIDGLLQSAHLLRVHLWPALLVRLKLLTGLDISETRQPQDGRMTLTLPGRTLDIRASTLPTLHGENLVLRLLDRNKGIRPLSDLGLDPLRLQQLYDLLANPEGLLLVTGPTGSGKTTTLYAMLQHLQDESIEIMTLEDPVEYALSGIRQTTIDPPRLDFANGVRALMRQDPDILLIGEIRDEETATMALRAAQTGHKVFSTLHAACPFTALSRLQQLHLPLSALRGTLNGILAQRLLRRLCPACRHLRLCSPEEASLLNLPQPLMLAKPVGCFLCRQTGYCGQIPLLEVLTCGPRLHHFLTDPLTSTPAELAREARLAGWQSLAEHGRQRVLAGETSLSELCRTVAPSTLRSLDPWQPAADELCHAIPLTH